MSLCVSAETPARSEPRVCWKPGRSAGITMGHSRRHQLAAVGLDVQGWATVFDPTVCHFAAAANARRPQASRHSRYHSRAA